MKQRLLFRITGVVLLGLYCMQVNAQDKKNYSYLPSCFANEGIDTAQIEIDGMGEVTVLDYTSATLKETGLMMYTIPAKKQDKSPAKLAMTATQFHVKLWKNNSKVVTKNEIKLEDAAIVDLRLHMLIENIYLQVITICQGDKIYQVSCFRDTNDTTHFDSLVKKIQEKNCL